MLNLRYYLVLFVVIFVFLLSGCEAEKGADEPVSDEPVPTPIVVDDDDDSGEVLIDETPVMVEFSREATAVSATSELADDTGWGFAYNPANVLDMDYSTAWCRSPEDTELTLTLNFQGPVDLGVVGLVPGFARDETIFYQNNRLKTVEVYYDDDISPVATLSFEDEYEMQFFTLPTEEASSVSFKIIEVYPGSKYDDTCVAEVDFWSDWVANQDATAAYDYYQQYKKDFALRPVGIDSVSMFVSEDSVTACTQPSYQILDDTEQGTTYFYPSETLGYSFSDGDFEGHGVFYSYNKHDDIYSFDIGTQGIFFKMHLNEYAREGDPITVKIIVSDCVGPAAGKGTKVLASFDVTAQLCNEDVYAVGSLDDVQLSPDEFMFCQETLQFYYGDRLIGGQRYGLIQ